MYFRRKNIKIYPKMNMIWTFKNKVHFKTFKSPYLFLGLILSNIFLHIYNHILSPYKINQTKFIKKMYLYEDRNEKPN